MESESFTKTVNLLKQLIDNDDAFVSISPPFELSFVIDKNILNRQLKEHNLIEDDFNEQRDLVENMLIAILVEREEQLLKYMSKDKDGENEIESIKNEFREDINKVRNALLSKHLKDRYALKSSSKAPSFTGIDWDIKLKLKDAKLDSISFPYATCRISYQRDFDESPATILGGRRFDAVQINFCLDDIEYLMKVFQTIKKHLVEIEGRNR